MTNKKKLVYNIYEIGNRSEDKGELNNSPDLVDQLAVPPSLSEYIKNFELGAPLPYVDNGEIVEDDDDNFNIQDFRNVDIDDLKEYSETVINMAQKPKQSKNNSFKQPNPDIQKTGDNQGSNDVKAMVPDNEKK